MSSISAAVVAGGLLVTAFALIWAAWSDVRHLMIPNRTSAAIAGSYLLAAVGMPMPIWISGILVALATFAVGAFLFARGWVGGGDVKLAAVTVLWAGPALLADFMLMVSIGGIVVAMLMLVLPKRRLAAGGSAGEADCRFDQPMPFGVPLAAGGLWVVALQLASLA